MVFQICSPVCTELEIIVMDWLGKFIGLPKEFLSSDDGKGGGIIQGSGSEAILVSVLAAREKAVRRVLLSRPELTESEIRGRLVAYSSDQSNSSIEKAGIISAVQMRLLPSDENCGLCSQILEKAITEDIANGKFPIACITTFGTTGTCAYDNLEVIGPICRKYNIWIHTDGAYAGAALCCPEYRYLMRGLEYSDSFNFNLHKWMMVNFECCAMWFRDSSQVVDAFCVNRIYLDHKYQNETSKAPDYRHWQIALGRRFRSLKVWIVLRTFGAEKLREHIRHDIRLAEMFANFIRSDDRFEVITKNSLALVCFKLKHSCKLTELLIERITARNQIYMIKATFRGELIIRFVVCGWKPEARDMEFAWNEIRNEADKLFKLIGTKVIQNGDIDLNALSEPCIDSDLLNDEIRKEQISRKFLEKNGTEQDIIGIEEKFDDIKLNGSKPVNGKTKTLPTINGITNGETNGRIINEFPMKNGKLMDNEISPFSSDINVHIDAEKTK